MPLAKHLSVTVDTDAYGEAIFLFGHTSHMTTQFNKDLKQQKAGLCQWALATHPTSFWG